MKIQINSTVKTSYQRVTEGFNEKLFRYLLPPESVAKLVRYDGEEPESKIHIRFYLPWKSDWISRITESKKQANEYYFIDKGVKLPFGLKQWTHKHIIKRISTEESMIVDEIDFSTGFNLTDFLVYPFLYFAFLPRKRSYRKYFETRKSSNSWMQNNQLKVIITY
jgi:ligand-binding SRPBCC domain-containing protein